MKLTPITACITIGGSVLCFGVVVVDDAPWCGTSGSAAAPPPLLGAPACVVQ